MDEIEQVTMTLLQKKVDEIRDLFVQGVGVTVVIRAPGDIDAVVITNDKDQEMLIQALRRINGH